MSSANESWSVLRGLRAHPPGRAADDPDRRAIFTAALEQAEQFLSAAATVGYATKPVQLFYALSQAGRAIAAVRSDDPWEIRGHGASVTSSPNLGATTIDLHSNPRGAVLLVAQATGSETWQGALTLGDLWASLPEVPAVPALCGSAHRPLEIGGEVFPQNLTATTTFTAVMPGFTTAAGLRLSDPPSDPDRLEAAVAEALAPYPRAAGWSLANMWTTNTLSDGPSPVWLAWSYEENGQRVYTALELLTERYGGSTYFRPGLGSGANIPSPLITWWGVLLALSSVARYEPVAWRAALDIDRSPIAWTLERGLAVAEERIPELVLEAATREVTTLVT